MQVTHGFFSNVCAVSLFQDLEHIPIDVQERVLHSRSRRSLPFFGFAKVFTLTSTDPVESQDLTARHRRSEPTVTTRRVGGASHTEPTTDDSLSQVPTGQEDALHVLFGLRSCLQQLSSRS